MQVRLRMGDVHLHALIDLGSTHNLIAEEPANGTGLPWSAAALRPSRWPMASTYRVQAGNIHHRQRSILRRLLRTPFAGVRWWLATLGPILWDFAALTMSFWHKDHPICWLLKKFVGTPPAAPPSMPPTHHGATVPEPECAALTRLAQGVRQVLIH
jgi:hypothetical protein